MDGAASKKIHSVLFVCAMNAVRSPMAEAIARHYFGKSIYVQSAGVRKGETDGFMATALSEIGIDGSKHKPRTLDELEEWEGLNFDLIISLSPEAHHAALELTRTVAAEWNTGRRPIRRSRRAHASRCSMPIATFAMASCIASAFGSSRDHRRARMTERVPRPARSPRRSMRVNAITAMAAATATIAGQPLSITTGRIVARMMEPGSARRPRSIRGVIGTRLMSSTPPMRHRNVTSIMPKMARADPQGVAMKALNPLIRSACPR